MNRKIWFAVFFLLSLALHVHLYMQGRIDPPWLLFPFFVCWGAAYLPVCIPVVLIEQYGFHIEPWSDGYAAVTRLVLTLAAAAFWFFPTARIARWFGSFDAFKDGPALRLRRRFGLRSLWQSAAAVLDTLHRMKLGKGKNGGWA